jgi:hypothetical protein
VQVLLPRRQEHLHHVLDRCLLHHARQLLLQLNTYKPSPKHKCSSRSLQCKLNTQLLSPLAKAHSSQVWSE